MPKAYHPFREERISLQKALLTQCLLHGDPYGTRTHVTAVKGRCLNHLTNGPGSGNLIRTDDIPGMNRVLYQLSYAAILTPPARRAGSNKHGVL